MRITGPVLTLAAVGAVAAGVTTANVVLTADPEPPPVEQATGALAVGSPLPAPAAPAAPTAPTAPPAQAGQAVYTGWSTDRAVSVDIRVEDGDATAYVCDNEGVESWTEGTVSQDGPTRLTGEDGGSVEYTVQDGTATGTASAGGRTWEFTAARAPEDAGAPAPAAPSTGGSGGSGGSDGSGDDGGGY